MCVWLEQDREIEPVAGSFFGFQGDDMNIFCENVDDIDLASMRAVLPFDRIVIRRAKGERWTTKSATEALSRIEYDICFDEPVEIKLKGNKTDELLVVDVSR